MRSSTRSGGSPTSAGRILARLVAGVVLLNLVVLIMAAMGLAQTRARHEERAASASKNLVVVLEREIASLIDKIDLVLLTVADEVARTQSLAKVDPAALDSFMARHARRVPELHALRTTDAAGEVNHGVGFAKGTRANLSNRAYFIQLAAEPNAGLVISKPLVSRVSGEWEIVLARRLTAVDGTFSGVVHATITLQHFVDILGTLDIGPNGAVSLRGADLSMIVRRPTIASIGKDVGDTTASPELKAWARTGEAQGNVTNGGADGITRTSSFRRISKYPLVVLVGLGTGDYLAEWRSDAIKLAVLLAAFLCLTILFAALTYRAWRRRDTHIEALGVQERKFRTLIESSPDALVIADANELITIVNRQAQQMFGYAADEMLGQPVDMLLAQRHRGRHLAVVPRPAGELAGAGKDRDLWALTKAGREFPVSISQSPIDTEQGGMVAAAIRDMTERHASQDRIEFLAHHDVLTGLPNRVVVKSRFEQAIAQANRSAAKVALLFLDLDNFKTVNDSLGHGIGDVLLKAVANRLRECARDTDTISRQGGDEFLLVFAQLEDADAARRVIERLVQSFQRPCVAEGHEIATSFSLGIALYPDDGTDFDTLLKKADIAMYQAKAAGRNTHRFFSEAMNVEALAHLHLRTGLRLALERSEFVLHYQPQIELAGGRVIGAEALLRWHHPELGLVPPGRFIPVAEDSGLIVPIGEWVLNEACHQAVAWQAAGLPHLTIAVNLSAVQFRRGNVEAVVQAALEASGLDPACLELELTESILMHDIESVLTTVKRLQLLGVKLSLDDFGTGYSSLSYLKRFAFDKLKIDQSFVRDLATDPESAAIVRAVLQMSRSLGLTAIAEGVENTAALESLLALNCDEAQGYLFARPMPAAALADYLVAAMRRTPTGAWSTRHGELVEQGLAGTPQGEPQR